MPKRVSPFPRHTVFPLLVKHNPHRRKDAAAQASSFFARRRAGLSDAAPACGTFSGGRRGREARPRQRAESGRTAAVSWGGGRAEFQLIWKDEQAFSPSVSSAPVAACAGLWRGEHGQRLVPQRQADAGTGGLLRPPCDRILRLCL